MSFLLYIFLIPFISDHPLGLWLHVLSYKISSHVSEGILIDFYSLKTQFGKQIVSAILSLSLLAKSLVTSILLIPLLLTYI